MFYFLNSLMNAVDLLFLARVLHHTLDLADFLTLPLQEVLVRVLLAPQRHKVLLFDLLTVKYELLHVFLDT